MSQPKSIAEIFAALDSPSHKAMRELYESPAAKAARDFYNSPSAMAARAFYDSPSAKAAREFYDSPTMQIARDIQGRLTAQQSWLETERQLTETRVRLAQTGLAGIEGGAVDSYRRLAAAGAITGGLADQYANISKLQSLLDRDVLASLSGPLADAARANQWASLLADTGATRLHALMATRSPIMDEIEKIQRGAMSLVSTSTEADRFRLSASLGLNARHFIDMETTRLKLSALAGAGDVLGFNAPTSFTAYEQLFGEWHTRPDLPPRFWRDPDMRRRSYREAEVDDGLIETTPAVAVEVVIESGFAAGVSESGTAIALLDIGGVSMQIRSTNFSVDAFRAIGAFEQALRFFIATKLAAVAGPEWFKHRVDGATRKKAQGNRSAALANGEREQALIAHLDLGDLIAILLRKDNWDEAFGYIFPNRQRLEFDLQALVAARRPTMHARRVDAVRLVELMCIVRRLTQWIEDDGDWKRIADSEE